MKKVEAIDSLVDRFYRSQKSSRTDNRQNKTIYSRIFDNNTVDAWRHMRMLSFIDPLIKSMPHATWLTVGDGSYGKEAHYLEERGADVLATDIFDGLLKKAKNIGFIKKCKRENAEKLSFENNSFDLILCKESYHHFPRPMIALYEMLRVAKEAVVLIEPNDVKKRGISWTRFWSVDLLGTQVNRFEVSGNYVYSLSRRELEKVSLGIGLPAIAFAGIDDVYIEKASKEKVSDNTKNFRKIKALIQLLDVFYRLGLRDRSLLVAVIFKTKPSHKVIKDLNNFGFGVHVLPRNPYIKWN